ncbi:putative phage tail protein [Vibrio phage VCPH]|nr:putative phage tail protein [Vibrio phage VCPH]
MYTQDDKTSDLILEEFADFGVRLTLEDVVTQCTNHPVTGEPINCKDVITPTDLTGVTFKADIVDSLEDSGVVIGSFTFSVVGAVTGGVVDMTMSSADVDVVAATQGVRDPYDKRLRHVGYYDITTTSGGTVARIAQGRVLVSDGATV